MSEAASMRVDLSRFRKSVHYPMVYRLAWMFIQSTAFRHSPRCAWSWRRLLLRLFGARIADGVRIDPACTVWNPRNVSIGRNCWIGPANELYAADSITIEDNVALAQHVLLYTASHDLADPLFPTITAPIVVRSQAWLAACTFVGPGVTIGEGAVLGARSSAFGDLPPWTICVGTPAKPMRARVLDEKEHAP